MSKWKTIDTAPKDGTSIWAYQDENHHQCQMKWIEGDEYALWVYTDELLADVCPDPQQPTFWMEVPPSPTILTSKE